MAVDFRNTVVYSHYRLIVHTSEHTYYFSEATLASILETMDSAAEQQLLPPLWLAQLDELPQPAH
ncbi:MULTISPECIES: hypothetical protein [Atopobium]|uniref:hypothetical protein n=1 Tax=Atopobium TaxID=1380 RepID=UPI000553A98F|nr:MULTISPECIES: hypothetical protein [Atopobium]KRN56093.1 hypothetical protein IV72_GL000227 [Atopobium minutum]MDU5357192.1 hypothetical protein [Atopobium minutum]MDU5892264.1 hypothetical protein [Atopobium minutum]